MLGITERGVVVCPAAHAAAPQLCYRFAIRWLYTRGWSCLRAKQLVVVQQEEVKLRCSKYFQAQLS